MATHTQMMRPSGHSGPRRPTRKAFARLARRRKAFDGLRDKQGLRRPGSLR